MATERVCDLCGRTVANITRHHLIPRTRHANKKNKKNFTREEVQERLLWICGPCHKNIHVHLTEKQLEYDYNTIEKLQAHPEVKKFSEWISKKPDFVTFPVRKARSKIK